MARVGENHTLIGVMLMLTTSIALAFMSALGKYAQETVTAYQVVFVQNVVSLLLIFPIVTWKRGLRGLKTKHIGLHLTRDFAGLIAYLALFFTLNYMPLIDAVLLNNTGPLFVPFVFLIWLHHRINRKLWWPLVLGFAGVVLILQPGLGMFHPAMLIGIVSGIGTAVTLVAITLLNRTEGPFLMLFYYFLVASIVMTPIAIWQWKPAPLEVWMTMIGIGLLMITVQLSLTFGFRQGDTTSFSPFLYFAVIWSGLIDWIVWRSIPNWLAIIGTVMVIAGGTLAILFRTPYRPERAGA